MRKIFLVLGLVLSFLVRAQNPADIDLALGNDYASFTNVHKIVRQPDGKILIGGAYFATGKVVRLNTDGSTDTSFQANSFTTYNGGSFMTLSDVVLQPDGKVLVGGLFGKLNGVGGQSTNGIARLNADGTKDTSFIHPVFTSGNATIHSIALQPDGKIIIGGGFRVNVNGHPQYNACRLNADGSIDNTFDFGIFEGPGSNSGGVFAVAVQSDGKVLLGGSFSQFNNEIQRQLIRVNTDGTKDTTFDIGLGGQSGTILNNIVVQPDNKILIGGGFTQWDGQQKARLVRLNTDGSLDDTFINEFSVSNTLAPPNDFSLQADGKIVAVGATSELYGQSSIWRLNSDGSFDNSLVHEDTSNTMNAVLVLPDDKIMIGGYLLLCDGVQRNCYARLNSNGSLDSSFSGQGLSDEVATIALEGNGKTLLGGSFTSYDAVSQNRIIRIADDGTKDTTFNIGTGFNNAVKIIVVEPNGKILVGGDFTAYNQQTANHLIRLNQDGTQDATFSIGTGFNERVRTLVLQADGKMIVGGSFTEFNGSIQNYLVRLNANGTKDPTFTVENTFNGRITALLLQDDGKLVVGGNFTTINGIEQRYLVRLNENGTKDAAFVAYQGEEFNWTFTEDAILDFATQPDGKIYIATAHKLRRLNADGSLDAAFNTWYYGTKSVAVQENGKILLGGTSDFISDYGYVKRLVRLHPDGTKDTTFDVSLEGDMEIGGFHAYTIDESYGCKEIVLQPDNKIWVGGNFFSYRGVASYAAIRLVGGEADLSNTNIDDLAKDTITLYPNPVQNTLNITAGKDTQVLSLEVYSVTGQLVLQTSHFESAAVSMLSSGLYLVKIKTDKGSVTRKILKE